jgi:hypothetical protein
MPLALLPPGAKLSASHHKPRKDPTP